MASFLYAIVKFVFARLMKSNPMKILFTKRIKASLSNIVIFKVLNS